MDGSLQLDSSAPTRVGLVTNIYTPYKEAMLREIAKLIDLKVYYCAQIESERAWDVTFSETYDYEVLPGKTIRLGRRNLHFNPALAARINSDHIDVMIVGEWANPTVILAPFWLRMKRIPRLLWSGSSQLEAGLARVFTYPLKRLIVAQYQGYVTYTSKAAEYLQKLGAAAEKITVAPVTVDTDFFIAKSNKLRANPGRTALRKKYGIAEDEVAIVFAGQMNRRKGVDLLINALTHFDSSHVKVLLAGSGPERERFEEMARDVGVLDQMSFRGHCSQEELVELYVAGDVFTLPSRKEPSGNVINEAMTVGLPVVISDQIGCDCVTDGQTGYVFRSEDIRSYANALNQLVSDVQLRADMGKKAAINIRKGFSIQYEAFQFAIAVQKTLNSLGRTFVPIAPLNSQLEKTNIR